jgi:6-pyruvoyltetrahydropterin/6-carboxytetrahydropterin synthase
VCIAGETLDPFGYLVDLARVESRTDELVAWLAGRSLNTLPEMAGLNPSVEHLCRICWEHLAASPEVNRCASLTVRIWENNMAWASFTRAL